MTPITFIRIEADILTRQDLSDKSKMLLGLIQSFNGKGLKMSNPDLAVLLGTSAKTISRSIAELSRLDIIKITGRQSQYRKIYLDKNGQVETNLLGQKCPSTGTNKGTTCPKMSNRTKQTKPSRGDDIQKSFDVFWTAYPKKVSKPQAQKAFRAINPDDALLDAMLAALEQHKASDQWSKDGGRYIPYPATWINGRRWEDKLDIDGDYIPPLEVTNAEADEIFRKAGIA